MSENREQCWPQKAEMFLRAIYDIKDVPSVASDEEKIKALKDFYSLHSVINTCDTLASWEFYVLNKHKLL